MHPNWVRMMREDCEVAEVPFFFKQWGDWGAVTRDAATRVRNANTEGWHNWPDIGDESPVSIRAGKAKTGRQLDGREWNEYPEEIHAASTKEK